MRSTSNAGAVLYDDVRARARRSKVRTFLTRRPNHLANTEDLTEGKPIGHRYDIGTQTVPINQIRASQGRCRDFDSDFNPLKAHMRQRWISVANARSRGVYLPPVDLIQIGNTYVVEDGHHRISVARALGEAYIEARVTVWELAN